MVPVAYDQKGVVVKRVRDDVLIQIVAQVAIIPGADGCAT
jgi:hypothetical protein